MNLIYIKFFFVFTFYFCSNFECIIVSLFLIQLIHSQTQSQTQNNSITTITITNNQSINNQEANVNSIVAMIMTSKMNQLPPIRLSSADQLELSKEGYKIGEPFAYGSFGVVYRATRWSEQQCAAKVIQIDKICSNTIPGRLSEKLYREMHALQSFKHRYLVEVLHFYHTTIQPPSLIIFMEMAEGGDLRELITKQRHYHPLDEYTASIYYSQIVEAIKYLHDVKGFAHRDLKPPNILLDRDHTKCMLTDFSLGCLVYDQITGKRKMSDTFCGTMYTMSPEVLLIGINWATKDKNAADFLVFKGYDALKADIWSAGTILYFILFGCKPYQPADLTIKDPVEWYEDIKSRCKNGVMVKFEQPIRLPVKEKPQVSSKAIKLIQKHLILDSAKRSTISEISTDPWFDYMKKLMIKKQQKKQNEIARTTMIKARMEKTKNKKEMTKFKKIKEEKRTHEEAKQFDLLNNNKKEAIKTTDSDSNSSINSDIDESISDDDNYVKEKMKEKKKNEEDKMKETETTKVEKQIENEQIQNREEKEKKRIKNKRRWCFN